MALGSIRQLFQKHPNLPYLLGLILILVGLSPFLKPLMTAAFLAYLMLPPVRFLRRKIRLPTVGAVLMVLALTYMILGYALFYISRLVVSDIQHVINQVPFWIQTLQQWLGSHYPRVLNWIHKWTGLGELNTGAEVDLLGFQEVLQGSMTAGSLVLGFVLVTVFVVLFYAYGRFIGQFLLKCLPHNLQKDTSGTLKTVHQSLMLYFRGLFGVMVCLMVLYSVALWLLEVKYALGIGIFSGLSIIVPYLGVMVSALLALLAALVHFEHWTQLLGVAICYVSFPLLDSFVLSPTFIGVSAGLPAGLVLIVLLLGGTWFGVLGAVYAVPVALLIRSVSKKRTPTG
jgi:predicted PurR-regulated permease PerM